MVTHILTSEELELGTADEGEHAVFVLLGLDTSLIIFSSFTSLLANIMVLFSFTANQYCIVHMYHLLFSFSIFQLRDFYLDSIF